MKKLFIISNESIYKNDDNGYLCDNLDMKSTPEGLAGSFEVNIIARKSKHVRCHTINIDKISLSSSIFSLLVGLDIFYQSIFGKDVFGHLPIGLKLGGPFGDELIAGSYLQRFSLFCLPPCSIDTRQNVKMSWVTLPHFRFPC